ncbi:eCIS core domain-containing protein [Pseudomonas akapageensis]|uniref:eCIS core domain-containing protein n=1 Tax=Pseudomonas akapageensis TaxID=2609961 RepID=UPI0014076692|nr:DUF4157 domain-containing protein [Pseudomonas akapageensis]
MLSVSLPAPLRFAALLLALGTWSHANAASCPQGEIEICLAGCLCVPDPQAITKQITDIAAPALAQWLVQSRKTAEPGAQPIPLNIKVQLQPYYDDRVLDAALYKVGDDAEMSAGGAMLQNEDTVAVTLIDIIVFKDADDAENNVALWAHELKHVQQYQEWGVNEFAARYTRNYNEVETPAYAIQAQVASALRASR